MDDKYVFISYSTKDGKVPFDICNFLEKKGINCWIAPRNILPGNTYAGEIMKGIRNCSAFLILTSSNTNDSEHVLNELETAVNSKKIVIPFRIENEDFTDDYMYYLSRKHWINYFDNSDKALELLLETLNPIFSLIDNESKEKEAENLTPIMVEGTHMLKKYFNNQKDAIVNKLSNNKIIEILENINFVKPRYFSGLLDVYFCENSEIISFKFKYDLRSNNYKDFKLLFKSINEDTKSFFINDGTYYDMGTKEKYRLEDEVDVSTINSSEVKGIFVDSFFNSIEFQDFIDDGIDTVIENIEEERCVISCGGYNLFNNFVFECTNDDYSYCIVSDDEGKLLFIEIKSIDGENTICIRIDEEVSNFDMPSTFGYTLK